MPSILRPCTRSFAPQLLEPFLCRYISRPFLVRRLRDNWRRTMATEEMKHFAFDGGVSLNSCSSYEETIEALNRLQSCASARQNPAQHDKLDNTLKYLQRCNVSLEEFEQRVPVIHVSGTKGKGSTCALCEGILRAHGYRTGLYTSPHLSCVRERIRINGAPLLVGDFTKYFWDVHSRLSNNMEYEEDMPMYFKFLTVMAFHVFLAEKVDVAIIEVGIGGELDCTNVLRKTPIVGITSLGLDHTKTLGDTIEKIAWQKAGIIKPGSVAFTISNHKSSAFRVLQERALEKQVELRVVPEISGYSIDSSQLSLTHRLNSPLAVQLAHSWMKWRQNAPLGEIGQVITQIDDTTLKGIVGCSWNGRFQKVRRGIHTFYLDGAHTIESTQLCAQWFDSAAPKNGTRLLVFNTTHGRNPINLLKAFVECDIRIALFCPNTLSIESNKIPKDFIDTNVSISDARRVTMHNLETWRTMGGNNQSEAFYSVEETISFVDSLDEECHVLVTGSLHLVGTVITVLQENSD